jgi:Ca2+/Na+ antiporter
MRSRLTRSWLLFSFSCKALLCIVISTGGLVAGRTLESREGARHISRDRAAFLMLFLPRRAEPISRLPSCDAIVE